MPSLHISLNLKLVTILVIQHGEFRSRSVTNNREDPAFALRDPTMIIADEASRRDGVLEVIRYYQGIYVGQRISNQLHIQVWNIYRRVKQDLPQTSNSLGGWYWASPRGAGGGVVGQFRQDG